MPIYLTDIFYITYKVVATQGLNVFEFDYFFISVENTILILCYNI